MEVFKLNNHFLYRIDRLDHFLSSEELMDLRLFSFVDVISKPPDHSLIKEYLSEEKKFIDFLFLIIDSYDSKFENSEVRYSGQSRFPKEVKHLFGQEQLELLKKIKSNQEPEERLVSKIQLKDLLELGIREILKIKININGVYIETLTDMSLIMQNIKEDELLEMTSKSGLFVLGKWEHSMWEH